MFVKLNLAEPPDYEAGILRNVQNLWSHVARFYQDLLSLLYQKALGSRLAEFKAILNVHGFEQIINKPTRVTCATKSLIDIILSNKPEFVKLSDVIPLWIGDHDLIGCVRKINHIKFKQKSLTCRNYKHYDSRAFSNQFGSVDWSLVYDNVDVHSAWLYMNTVIMGIFDKHAPLITKRVKGKPAAELESLIMKGNAKQLHEQQLVTNL